MSPDIYAQRRAAGACVGAKHCSMAPIAGDVMCEHHRDIKRRAQKLLYRRRVLSGKCTECARPTDGDSRCGPCKALIREKRRAKRERGICSYTTGCGRAAKNGAACTLHAAHRRAVAKALLHARLEDGLCGRCGRAELWNGSHCEPCARSQGRGKRMDRAMVIDVAEIALSRPGAE